MNKSRKRVEQDYARNAIADGNTKAGKYEAKMAVKEAAGESPAKMYGKKKGSPAHNQNKGYESAGQERKNLMQDNPIASHAGGSWMSKHSMAAGSPVHKGGSYKGSPAHQQIQVDTHPSASNAKGESQEDVINRVNKSAGEKAMKANETITRNNRLLDSLTNDSKMKLDAYNKSEMQRTKSTDSIVAVNKKTFGK